MTLPSRDELNQMVDSEFREQHPNAPERLDPDQPAHAQLIANWVAIRDRKATEWTDDIFASFFPDAGRLDPGDPRDRTLIDYWTDIRNQLRDGPPGKYDWSNFAPTTAAPYRRADSGSPDEPDPVTPDATDAIAAIRRTRDTLVEIFNGTDLAAKISHHIDTQIGELVRVNGEGGLGGGQPWQSVPFSATAPDPDSDEPYFIHDLVVHATLDSTTFTLEGRVTGTAKGPGGTIDP